MNRHRTFLCLLAALMALLGQGALVAGAGWHHHDRIAGPEHGPGDHDGQDHSTAGSDCDICHLMHAPVTPGTAAAEPGPELCAWASRLGQPAPAHLRWVRATCARGPPLPA